MPNNDKRILIMSDPHVGATTGLTPLGCDYNKPFHQPRRQELHDKFWGVVRELGHIDHVICVGDAIHGPVRGKLTDEILVNEPDNQASLAFDLFDQINADSGLLVHGTPWHVGESATPIEQEIADHLGWEFHKIAEEHTVNNLIFHVKHKIGGSNSPRTLGNALLNDHEAILQNHVRHNVPTVLPDVLLRGHRHVFHQRGDEDWIGFILPCLQAWGGNIAVQMTATYYPTVGLMWFDVQEDGMFEWRVDIWKLKTHEEN